MRAGICPARKPALPGQRLRWGHGSVAKRKQHCRSRSQGRRPSKFRRQWRCRRAYAAGDYPALLRAHAVDETSRGLHNPRAPRFPTRPSVSSAPCTKSDSFPPKYQLAKVLREVLPKVHVPCETGKGLHSHLAAPATASHYNKKRSPMPHLFEPLKMRDVEFPHRIVVSPMCQYSCKDGFATDWHFVHLGSRAVGRAAAVIAEATAVTADGRISPQDLGIWTDAHVEPLRRAFSFIAEQGAVPGIQLAHAGRKASTSQPW